MSSATSTGGVVNNATTTDTTNTDLSRTTKGSEAAAGGDLIQLAPNFTAESISGPITLTDLGAQKAANDLLATNIPTLIDQANAYTKSAQAVIGRTLDSLSKKNDTGLTAVGDFLAGLAPWLIGGGLIYFLIVRSKEKKHHAPA